MYRYVNIQHSKQRFISSSVYSVIICENYRIQLELKVPTSAFFLRPKYLEMTRTEMCCMSFLVPHHPSFLLSSAVA